MRVLKVYLSPYILSRTTDTRWRNHLHCTPENKFPIPNFQVRPKHVLSAASAQNFRFFWFMPSLGVRSLCILWNTVQCAMLYVMRGATIFMSFMATCSFSSFVCVPQCVRAVGTWGGGGAGQGPIAPSDFGRSVNPISIKGVDFAHHFSSPPPNFQTFLGFRYLARGFIVVAKN